MNKLTGTEIIEILNNNYSMSSIGYGEWAELEEESEVGLTPAQQATINDVKEQKGNYWELNQSYILENLGLGKVVEVEQHGGEGEGDSWHVVHHFVDHDVYIRLDAYYQSYSGTDFDGSKPYEVRPKEKTITVYC